MDQNSFYETPEQESEFFTIVNDNGEEVQCEILFSFKSDETGKDYIIYTDYSTDEDGNYKVLASVYKPDSPDTRLYPIETDAEWELIEKLFAQLQENIEKTDNWDVTIVD